MANRWIIGLAPSLCLLACSPQQGTQQDKPGADQSGPRPVRVEVATVRVGRLDSKLRFLGNVQSAMSTPIAAAVAGTVDTVSVRAGQAVAKGALMIELDARRIRADLNAAQALAQRTEAQLAQARRQSERIRDSGASLSAPERERFQLDVAVLEAQLASERAAAQRVRVDLSQHRISAPFAGVLKARLVNPGAWVKAGDPVAELVSTEELEVLVDVPLEAGQGIRPGDSARFLRAGKSAAATVAGVVPALDASTRTMRLRLEIADGVVAPSWLIPGLAVDVELRAVVEGEGVLVPRDAVIRGPVENRVIVVRGGAGVPVSVELLGATAEEALVYAEGIAAGDQVMTRGNERYRPGSPVIIEQP